MKRNDKIAARDESIDNSNQFLVEAKSRFTVHVGIDPTINSENHDETL